MRRILSIVFLLAGIGAGCGSSRSTSSTAANASVPTQPERPFVFSFFISGSGGGMKAQDSWTLDTTGLMAVHTLTPTAPGRWNTVNAMATLDPQDHDSLVHFIRSGRLWEVDSVDIDQQCAGDELYAVIIAVLGEPHQMHATFHGCAQDYNLLLEPQRAEFKRLMEWWERMRVKYRPVQP